MKYKTIHDLTEGQKKALVTAGNFLLDGEWRKTINGFDRIMLERAIRKLQESIARDEESYD